MKTIDTVKMTDIARAISFLAMLTYIVILSMRLIASCLSARLQYQFTEKKDNFNCAHVRKRAINKVAHDCKNAVFPRNY